MDPMAVTTARPRQDRPSPGIPGSGRDLGYVVGLGEILAGVAVALSLARLASVYDAPLRVR
jgi:hypothetical protein